MSTDHVYLVGMPGSGKSTAGRALAEVLGLPFVDLDQEIERVAGSPVAEIFRDRGEPGFRSLERAALERAAAGPPAVVACGGQEGVVRLFNGTTMALIKALAPPGTEKPPEPKK